MTLDEHRELHDNLTQINERLQSELPSGGQSAIMAPFDICPACAVYKIV